MGIVGGSGEHRSETRLLRASANSSHWLGSIPTGACGGGWREQVEGDI